MGIEPDFSPHEKTLSSEALPADFLRSHEGRKADTRCMVAVTEGVSQVMEDERR